MLMAVLLPDPEAVPNLILCQEQDEVIHWRRAPDLFRPDVSGRPS